MEILVFWSKEEFNNASKGSVVNWDEADDVSVSSLKELKEIEDSAYRVFYLDGVLYCDICNEEVYGSGLYCPNCGFTPYEEVKPHIKFDGEEYYYE